MIALFFDTETNGIHNPKLVQLGAVLQDLDSKKILGEINLIQKPEVGMVIPKEASDIHGISQEMAERFGVSHQLVDLAFASFLKRCDIVVAHNISYDLQVIANSLPASHNLIKEKKQLCTMIAARDVVKAPFTEKQLAAFKRFPHYKDADYKNPNLTEAYRHFFGVELDGAHDAMADIRATRDVYIHMLDNELLPQE